MAHKVRAGSTKNNRDSKPKYLGIKKFPKTKIKNNAIILKQRGLKFITKNFHNININKEQTLVSSKDGICLSTKN